MLGLKRAILLIEVLLIPLVSLIVPPIPGIGPYFTGLGFSPTPFPLNILPLFVVVWLLVGGTGVFMHVRRALKQMGKQKREET